MSRSRFEHIKNHLATMARCDNRSKRQDIRIVISKTLDKYKKRKESEYQQLMSKYKALLIETEIS